MLLSFCLRREAAHFTQPPNPQLAGAPLRCVLPQRQRARQHSQVSPHPVHSLSQDISLSGQQHQHRSTAWQVNWCWGWKHHPARSVVGVSCSLSHRQPLVLASASTHPRTPHLLQSHCAIRVWPDNSVPLTSVMLFGCSRFSSWTETIFGAGILIPCSSVKCQEKC